MPKINTREDLPVVALSIPEIAVQTGFSKAMIYKQAKAGKLKLRKLGSRTFALPGDVDAMLRGKPMAQD